uniref:Uncharacterized protein n=1 Tax=Oryza brachyantha TaxID=4533 RepID=J3M808_ORYBR
MDRSGPGWPERKALSGRSTSVGALLFLRFQFVFTCTMLQIFIKISNFIIK